MKYWRCQTCLHEELVTQPTFFKDCQLCKTPLKIVEVRDELVNAEIVRQMNEVKTRNPNRGTLVEVVQRDAGFSIVERVDHHEGGTYETDDQKRAGRKDTGVGLAPSDEGLQGS